jgi:antitoxin component of RelBE/YafQ-DinJ toxin-antitoxin module
MGYKNDKTKFIKFRIDEPTKKNFIEYCENNDITVSEKIRNLMLNEMKND